MNVDEAMAIAVKRFGWPFKHDHHSNPSIISHAVLAEEVNRLTGEAYFQKEANKGLIAELAEKKAENDKLRAKLAAAKAASVVPVRVVYYESDYDQTVKVALWSNADAQRFADWLRDRMKEGGNQ